MAARTFGPGRFGQVRHVAPPSALVGLRYASGSGRLGWCSRAELLGHLGVHRPGVHRPEQERTP